MSEPLLRVAVPAPFPEPLDYLPPLNADPPPVGARVRVPLARARTVGVVVEYADQASVAATRLRRVQEVLDTEPLVPAELLALVRFTAAYYHYPPGETLAGVLPVPLRQGKPARAKKPKRYRLRGDEPPPMRGSQQQRLMQLLAEAGPSGLAYGEFDAGDRKRLRQFLEQALIEPVPEAHPAAVRADSATALNAAQQTAADEIIAARGGFTAFLLEGVTGSGKTEVYLAAIRDVLERGLQALVLVPEIALTPQLIARFEAALGIEIAAYHSGLAEGDRLATWLTARSGKARVIVGTRSAVFLPLADPGLIVVDEEHDGSFKQQDGLRYHGRDLAVYRARELGVPVVLGSATPALESLANASGGRYRHLSLPERAGMARAPAVTLVDVRGQRMDAGLSNRLVATAREHLDTGGQVLFFLNRRGFAPVVLCHACGDPIECKRCSARMTYHRGRNRLLCHHCGAQRPVPPTCPACGEPEQLLGLGKGTERLEAVLADHFPDVKMVRVDRDTTRRRGQLDALMAAAASGSARILVGTQMLAKGHDFKALTLVAIVDADQGLYGIDYRAPERMAQLIVQVSGRAGRADRAGQVMIQTRQPEHPLFRDLLRGGYGRFAARALAERQRDGLPPFGAQALMTAQAGREQPVREFLQAAANVLRGARGVRCLGPAPAPMLRRAGRFRYQLLLEAGDRGALHRAIADYYPRVLALPAARRVRVALDVDPIDLS